jgi:hypothetical protein
MSSRNVITSLCLVGAFLAGCVVAQHPFPHNPFVVPPAQAGTNPQRWEHLCSTNSSLQGANDMSNAVGREGWELTAVGGVAVGGIGMGGVGAGAVLFCFKRPLL